MTCSVDKELSHSAFAYMWNVDGKKVYLNIFQRSDIHVYHSLLIITDEISSAGFCDMKTI